MILALNITYDSSNKKGCLELLKRQAEKYPDDHHYRAAISSMEATLLLWVLLLHWLEPFELIVISLDQKLSSVVSARISSLIELLNHPGVRPDEILNVKAVIEAYETGFLSAETGKSVWIHGKRCQECEKDDLNIHALPAGLSYENAGLMWVENVSHLSFDTCLIFLLFIIDPMLRAGPCSRRRLCSTLRPVQMAITMKFRFHDNVRTWCLRSQYLLLVRLPGTELTIEVFVLDDTGSSVIDLFEFPDTILLRPAVDRLTWVCLDTNNERVWKRSLNVEVNMRDNYGAFIFKKCRTMQAWITQGNSQESVRCSGGFVREVLFTGTAAKADSKLVLSTTKTGMTAKIPAR